MLKPVAPVSDLSAVMAPVEAARGVPNRFYADPSSFELEKRTLFANNWTCIGFGASVPNPGDVMPIDHMGTPLLLVRDKEGSLAVFENVCRHRGMILVDAPRNVTGALRCPYHSWCYDLKGRLRATPHVGGPGLNTHTAIDPDKTGLTPVRFGVFLDCVFVNMAGNGPDFDVWIAPLAKRWQDFAGRDLFHGVGSSFKLNVACNWKLAVENYCESYHLPWIHPGLNAYSRLEDHYNIADARHHSGQGTVVYNPNFDGDLAFPNFANLPDKWDTAAEYIALYPNVLLGVHRDHVFAIRLEPLAHNQTREHIEIYYTSKDAAQSDAFAELRAQNAKLWKDVFEEDIYVVEGMQKGRGAPGFDGGVFSPVMDMPTHTFHDWVAAQFTSVAAE